MLAGQRYPRSLNSSGTFDVPQQLAGNESVACRPTTTGIIYAAIAGNCLVALTKFAASHWTGGSAMLAEGVHSLVDTGNQLLLLYGMHRSRQRPTPERPLGHGRELYFWSFIVALLIFSLGAGVAVLEGIFRIVNPAPIEDAYVNYIVLALAFVFEGTTWWIAARGIDGPEHVAEYFEAFRRSKDPPSFMVLFEDSAAVIGIVIAFGGTWAATTWRLPILDGVASILIGLVIAAAAAVLAVETKSLLIGETASREIEESIKRLVSAVDGILRTNGIITLHMAPDQILAALSLEFDDRLTTPDWRGSAGALLLAAGGRCNAACTRPARW